MTHSNPPQKSTNVRIDIEIREYIEDAVKAERRSITAMVNILLQEAIDARRARAEAQ